MTLEEATTLLPVFGALVTRARTEVEAAGRLEGQIQHFNHRIHMAGGLHVDVPAAARRRATRDEAVQRTRATLEELEQVGARVADLAEGRLEIACRVEGRQVLLCWTEGEESIERWREEEDGSPERSIADGPFRRERPH